MCSASARKSQLVLEVQYWARTSRTEPRAPSAGPWGPTRPWIPPQEQLQKPRQEQTSYRSRSLAGKKLKNGSTSSEERHYTVPLPRGATHGSWRPLARSSTFWRSLDTVFCFTWKKWDGVAGKRLHTQMLHGNDATTTIWRRKQMLSQRLTPIDGVGLKATLKCTISPFDIPPCTLRKQTDSIFFREQCHSHNR